MFKERPKPLKIHGATLHKNIRTKIKCLKKKGVEYLEMCEGKYWNVKVY